MTASDEALAAALKQQQADHFTYVADAVGDFAVGRADMVYVFDAYGNKYLDLSAGDGAMAVGHNNLPVIGGVYEQLLNYGHTARSGEHVMHFVTEYAKAISATFSEADGSPRQVLFCAGEYEAQLLAVALARAATGRNTVVTLRNEIEVQGTMREAACVQLELIEESMRPVDQGWARLVTEQAERDGAMVIVNEARTGYGRTGSMWLQEQYGLDPAITVLGGAGGGGFPFGAVVASRHAFDAYTIPRRQFGASAAICRAGAVVLEQLTGPLLEHVVDCGHVFDDAVAELRNQFPELVSGSHGLGLAKGVLCPTVEIARQFFVGCINHGLLLRPPIGRVLVVTPPLLISESELRHAVDVMASVALDWTEPL